MDQSRQAHHTARPLHSPAARPFRQPTFARKVELAGQAILQPAHPPRRHRVLLRRKMRTIRNRKSTMTSPSITVLTVPCPLGPGAHSSAASPSEPRSRPSAGASGPGSGVVRGIAARRRHEDWDLGLEVWRRVLRLLCDAGNKPQPLVGPSPRPACAEVPGNRFAPCSCTTARRTRAPSLGRQIFQPAGRRPRVPRHSVSSQHDPGLPTRTTIEKKPAGRSHAQRKAAGHR